MILLTFHQNVKEKCFKTTKKYCNAALHDLFCLIQKRRHFLPWCKISNRDNEHFHIKGCSRKGEIILAGTNSELKVALLLYYAINNDPPPRTHRLGLEDAGQGWAHPRVSELPPPSPHPVCGNTSACSLPWNAALVEELASAGEELLERELKGDCLKHSSRNGLRGGDAWRQQLHRQLVTLTHSLTRCKRSCWLRVTPSPGTQYNKVSSAGGSGAWGSPAYSHHVAVLVVVGFADFFWKTDKKINNNDVKSFIQVRSINQILRMWSNGQ